ncbi:MAG TPA: DUF2235 domain-containing protein [Acidobacteriaceae bacterium]|jgi:uncharacterized protein (DUF2235 family)
MSEDASVTSQVAPSSGKPGKKKIVVCCDGTGNDFRFPNVVPDKEGSGQNSNVVKFYTALQIDNEQVGYYHPGVGTMGAPTATHWYTRQWTKIKGVAFGYGFRDNVLDAYRYLMENYNDNNGDGDEVYIVGFSRGAYTARALAGLLHGYGLLCRGNEGHLAYAWRMYVAQHGRRGERTVTPDEAFKETFAHPNFTIKFVGVWDTVSSVGWISTPLRLFNVSQNDSIQIARHAVSIDERRCFFTDNLWGEPSSKTDLVQVWFPGVHSDVGGSYLQTESKLSDTALRWMLDEAAAAGIRLHPIRSQLVIGIVPDGTTDHEELLLCTTGDLYFHESLKGPWWLVEFLPHIYYDKDLGEVHGHTPEEASKDSAELRRIPFGEHRQLPDGALLHASVIDLMADSGLEKRYAPPNILCGKWAPSGISGQDGREYFRYTAPPPRPPNALQRAFQSKPVMWTIGCIELGFYAFVLTLILFVVLHFAIVLIVCLLHHTPVWITHPLHVIYNVITWYPRAWGWCRCS